MADTRMRFGVFLAPNHPIDESPTLFFERDLQLIRHVDMLGFDECWVGEHHSGAFETIGAPELVLAAAAERTKHIRLGVGVKSLPYHNPFILADTMVQLDHMTRGRTMFGIGPGALPSDAWQLGIDVRETRRMMEEATEAIVRLLAGERVTMKTDWFHLREAKLQHGCYTRPRMEMAVTSIRSPAGALVAGKYGMGMLSLGGATDDALAAYRANWAVCEEAAAEHGRVADRAGFRIAAFMHLAPTREQAREEVRFGIEPFAQYTRDVLPNAVVPEDAADPVATLIETRRAVIGTPDDAVAQIERMVEGTGGFGVVLLMAQDWADWQATLRSYELFARYVIPRVQDRLAPRQASYEAAKALKPRLLDDARRAVADAQARYDARRDPRAAE